MAGEPDAPEGAPERAPERAAGRAAEVAAEMAPGPPEPLARLAPTETAEVLGAILAGRGVTQYRAAKLAGTSQPYLNQVVTGRRRASGEWIDLVAGALDLAPEERERLHRAAARDHGFRIDLTKPEG